MKVQLFASAALVLLSAIPGALSAKTHPLKEAVTATVDAGHFEEKSPATQTQSSLRGAFFAAGAEDASDEDEELFSWHYHWDSENGNPWGNEGPHWGDDCDRTEGCSCDGGNCDMPNCTNDCSCDGGNCDMPKCTNNCKCSGGNCEMPMCTSSCSCDGGNCSWSCNNQCSCGGGNCSNDGEEDDNDEVLESLALA
ncbi:hypothetical protein ACHAXM_001195 [Skeletonema potamos]